MEYRVHILNSSKTRDEALQYIPLLEPILQILFGVNVLIGTKFAGLVKMSNTTFELIVAKSEFVKLFLYFLIKSDFAEFFDTCKSIFWDGFTMHLHGCIPPEGGWDTCVGKSSSIQPKRRIIIENPWGLYYKTFYGSNFSCIVISQSVCQCQSL